MDAWLSRLEMLVGEDAVKKLKNARVAVFGLGGVGSYAAEALCRSGVGSFVLVDGDEVAKSNINRQLYALTSTVGMKKTDVAKARMEDINPDVRVEALHLFYLPEHGSAPLEGCDIVVDAIDTVASKLALAVECRRLGIPLLSSMGTGNKLDPGLLRAGDIMETHGCPLCRVMRRELKKRGVDSLRVVWSPEPPIEPKAAAPDSELRTTGRMPPGSCAFVPPAAGLMLAAEAVRILTEDTK